MTPLDTSLSFAREAFTEQLMAELGPMLREHLDELSHAGIPVSIDEGAYLAFEANGTLRVFTVREGGRLVGYAVFIVANSPHHASSLQAIQDMIYVLPDYRGYAGARLLHFADGELREDGVQVAFHVVNAKRDWGALLERMGYEPVERVFMKRLDLPENNGEKNGERLVTPSAGG